jgi:multiple sugar transport system permease protein
MNTTDPLESSALALPDATFAEQAPASAMARPKTEPLQPSPAARRIAGLLVILYAALSLIPLVWIVLTSFRTPDDAIAYPPKVVAESSLVGYVNLFTTRSRVSKEELAKLPPPATWYEKLVRDQQMILAGPSRFADRYVNSLVVGFGSTLLAVVLGTLAAYGFSRFRVPGRNDLLFFILSTRMMPPVAIAIPVYLMYRQLGLSDTYTGLVLLYTVVNLSLAVWLLKGFMDEIPREYEEAALIDGYTRLQAFRKVVLPQAATGIATTAIFCLIFAWNEYAFSLLLTSGSAQTAPPFIPTIIGEGGLDWPAMAAATTLFLLPVMVFTVLLRKHLLRGITFGAIRK